MVEAADHKKTAKLILEAAINNRRWETAVDGLREQVGAAVAGLCEWDFTTGTGDIVHSAGYSPQYLRAYRTGGCEYNPWLRAVAAPVLENDPVGDEAIPAERLRASRFFRDWLAPQGLFHRLSGAISCNEDRMVYVEVMRGESQGAFEPQTRQLIVDLLPYFRQALACNENLYRLAISDTILNGLARGMLVVDPSARLVYGNRAGLEEAERQRGLALRSGRIQGTASKTNQRLQRLIAATAAIERSSEDDRERPALHIPRGGDLAPLLLNAEPLARPLRRIVGQRNNLVVLVLSIPESIGKLPERRLRCDFGLTAAEQRVALLVAGGHRLGTAADELGISFNTARAHMKRVYAKTNTDHQSGFVHMLFTGSE